MRLGVIADPDGAQLALRLEVHQRAPFVDPFRAARRGVDQVEIDLVEPQRRARGLEGGEGLVVALGRIAPGGIAGPELGGDEYVFAAQAILCKPLSQAFAHALFVVVARGGVDMAIPGGDGRGHRGGGVVVLDEIGAVPDQGQAQGLVGCGEGGNAHERPPAGAPDAGPVLG